MTTLKTITPYPMEPDHRECRQTCGMRGSQWLPKDSSSE